MGSLNLGVLDQILICIGLPSKRQCLLVILSLLFLHGVFSHCFFVIVSNTPLRATAAFKVVLTNSGISTILELTSLGITLLYVCRLLSQSQRYFITPPLDSARLDTMLDIVWALKFWSCWTKYSCVLVSHPNGNADWWVFPQHLYIGYPPLWDSLFSLFYCLQHTVPQPTSPTCSFLNVQYDHWTVDLRMKESVRLHRKSHHFVNLEWLKFFLLHPLDSNIISFHYHLSYLSVKSWSIS